MTERWFIEHWEQLMSGADEIMHEIRQSAAQIHNDRVQELLQQAEQQRTATEAALRHFGEQQQALMQTIDQLQTELAVAGRPLRGEVS